MVPRVKEIESLLIKGFNAKTDSSFQPGKVIIMRFEVGRFYATGKVIALWGVEKDAFGNITGNRIKKVMPSEEALNAIREARKKYDTQQNPVTKFSATTAPAQKRVVVGKEFPSIEATLLSGISPKSKPPKPLPFMAGGAAPKTNFKPK